MLEHLALDRPAGLADLYPIGTDAGSTLAEQYTPAGDALFYVVDVGPLDPYSLFVSEPDGRQVPVSDHPPDLRYAISPDSAHVLCWGRGRYPDSADIEIADVATGGLVSLQLLALCERAGEGSITWG